MLGFEDIDKDRDIVRKFVTWLSGSGQKYVTVIPFDCSLSDIVKAIRSVLRHDHINTKMAERIRRIAR
jgi:hypothetical protein